MDPITIGVVVVVGALLFMRSSPAASAQGGAPIAGSTGATMTMKGRPVAGDGTPPPTDTSPNRWPPPPPNPSDVAQVMFGGAKSVAEGARNQMADTLNNLTATAKQRATGLTGGLDPAFVDAGSAKAAVAFMQRGLTTIDSSIYNAFGSTQTGAAIQRKVAKTGAEIIAAVGARRIDRVPVGTLTSMPLSGAL